MRNYLLMLNLILLIGTIFPTSEICGQYQVSNVFRKYRNDEGVQHINLSGDIAKMLQGEKDKLVSRVDEMHVYIFSKENILSAADRDKITKARQGDGYETLFQTRDKADRLEIYGIEKQGKITHIYGEIVTGGNRIFLLMTGSILFSELSKMNFDFDGSEVMKKIPVP